MLHVWWWVSAIVAISFEKAKGRITAGPPQAKRRRADEQQSELQRSTKCSRHMVNTYTALPTCHIRRHLSRLPTVFLPAVLCLSAAARAVLRIIRHISALLETSSATYGRSSNLKPAKLFPWPRNATVGMPIVTVCLLPAAWIGGDSASIPQAVRQSPLD